MEHPEPDDLGGHPLFPRAPDSLGPDLRKFDLIQIIRTLPDKKTIEVCPRLWKGSELQSWEQIVDAYGGECFYQLQAMCGKTHRYTARSEKYFFGSPARLPFVQSGMAAAPQPQMQGPPPQVAAAPPPQYAYPPAPPAPPAPAPQPSIDPQFLEFMKVLIESHTNTQARIVQGMVAQPAPQPQQKDPTMEAIRLVAAIVKARNAESSADDELMQGMRLGLGLDGRYEEEEEEASGGSGLATLAGLLMLAKLTAGRQAPPRPAQSSQAAPPATPTPPMPQPSAPPAQAPQEPQPSAVPNASAPNTLPLANGPWSALPPNLWKGWELVWTPDGLLLRPPANAGTSDAPRAPAPASAPVAPPPPAPTPTMEMTTTPPAAPPIPTRRTLMNSRYLTAAGFVPKPVEDSSPTWSGTTGFG